MKSHHFWKVFSSPIPEKLSCTPTIGGEASFTITADETIGMGK